MLVTDYIIEYLKRNEGITHVFTYVGGTDAPLLNSLYHSKGITYIAHRHEEFASIAAIGYSLASDKLGVAISMSGPGATHMVTGIIDAWFDSVPVLYLTGQVTRSTYKFDNPSRQIGYQETDIVSIVKTITKKATLEIDETKVPERLKEFIREAKSHRQGPVLLDIPFDVLREDISDKGIEEKVKLKETPPISDIMIRAFLELLKESRRPLIIAGGGVKTKKSRELLLKFAETLQIPVVTSFNGKSAFPNDNPLYFGFIGAYGNRYANITMANSDLIIAIGSRLDSRQTSNPKYFARAARKVHIEIDRNEINNNVMVDLPIHGDINEFMEKVLQEVNPVPSNKYKEWMEYFKKVKKEFDVVKDIKGSDKNVHPKKFLLELSKANNDDTIYIVDIGNNGMFAAQSMIVKKNQRFLVSGGLGTMGFALPAGIGAYFGAPGHKIISIMGDGGFQMAIQELQTIVHHNIPMKIIVLNNKVLGLMKVFQDENYDGAHAATEDGYSVPDLEKIAYAFGLKYKKLNNTEEAIDFIPELLNDDSPLLVDVTVHPDWTGYPKIRRGYPIEYQNPPIPDEKLEKFMLIPMFQKDKDNK